jgi:hypothetical protein
MSYTYAYNPKVLNPDLPNSRIPQMTSGGSQVPFFFGGSQIPIDLHLPIPSYDGSYRSDALKMKGQGIKVYIPRQKYYVK